MSAVFVTGGSGFIGGGLLRTLLSDGRTVRALVRSDAAATRVAALGAEPVRGDLDDRAALHAGASGCELAFHAAALTSDWGPWQEFERINVHGTRNVCAACRAAGIRRLVHVSTEAVLLAGDPLVDVDERAPLRPDSKAPYAASKAQAEQTALDANGEGLEVVVVRPRFVWGAGDTTLLPQLLELVRRGRFAWIGGGRHLTDTTHVDNAVHGLMLAAQKARPAAVYFVTDGQPVVFREFVSELLRTQDVEPPERSIPAPIARAIAAAGEDAWRLLRLPGSPPLTRFAYWVSSQQCTINITRARSELGYSPIRSRSDGLDELRTASPDPT